MDTRATELGQLGMHGRLIGDGCSLELCIAPHALHAVQSVLTDHFFNPIG